MNLDKIEIISLREQGYSIKRISKHLKCCIEIVTRFMKDNNISCKKISKPHLCLTCGDSDIKNFNGLSKQMCKLCASRNHTKRSIEKRHKAKEIFNSKCQICGYNKFIGALEFHHIDPKTKEHSLVHTFKLSDEKIKEELEKCILLCSNCHKEVHAGLHKDKINLIGCF